MTRTAQLLGQVADQRAFGQRPLFSQRLIEMALEPPRCCGRYSAQVRLLPVPEMAGLRSAARS